MKRAPLVAGLMAAVLVCAALVGAFVVMRPAAEVAAAVRTTPAALETAALPWATRVIPPPEARFDRTIFASTTMPGSGVMLDLCRGPIAIDLGATHPLLVAEHDYCGGSAWIPRLRTGDTVDLGGKGLAAGRYVVTDIAYGQRRVSRFSDLPDATVVLQTCVSETKIIMVGLDLAANSVAS